MPLSCIKMSESEGRIVDPLFFTQSLLTMQRNWIRLACGLDISKGHFHACFGAQDAAGKFVTRSQRKFANSPSGIKGFIQWLLGKRTKEDRAGALPFQVVLETTGVYHEAVLWAGHEAGLPMCLELARRVKKYLQSIGQVSKTDKLDASGICRLGCERQLRRWQPLSPHIYALRTALRQRKALIKQRTQLSNQFHAASHSQASSKVVMASMRRLRKAIEKEIERLESHIHELYQTDEVLVQRLEPIIDSVKGLGLITALTAVAETNGFDQITSRKQLASYAGYDIIENSSGNSTRKTRISKQGNVHIRAEMYMAAVCVIRLKHGPLYALYERVRKRNPKVYKIANVAVQRKLLLLIFTLFKKQERFDPEKYALPKDQRPKTSSSEPSPELHEIERQKIALPLES